MGVSHGSGFFILRHGSAENRTIPLTLGVSHGSGFFFNRHGSAENRTIPLTLGVSHGSGFFFNRHGSAENRTIPLTLGVSHGSGFFFNGHGSAENRTIPQTLGVSRGSGFFFNRHGSAENIFIQTPPIAIFPSTDYNSSSMSESRYTSNFPHSPPHWLEKSGTYIVTAGTFKKQHIFRDAERLSELTNMLLNKAAHFNWNLQAWAVFSNHYHIIAESDVPDTLPEFMRLLHSAAATKANKMDNTPGRKVWQQYWETRISYYRSWLARLNYVNQNPVKHGIVQHATSYPYCSAGWFEAKANAELSKTVARFDYRRVYVIDDF